MLDVDNAATTLRDWGLIADEDIVRGDLRLVDAGRRNRNFRVIRRDRPSYLVKQPVERDAFVTLGCEAAFYSFCAEEPAAAPARALVPRLAAYRREECVLALGLLEGVQPFGERLVAAGVEAAEALGRGLGRALGVFHRTFRAPGPLEGDPRLAWLGRHEPWVLWVHKPGPEILSRISPGNLQTLQILQGRGELRRNLDPLRKLWRCDTVIHNDIKSDNVLVRPAEGGAWDVWLVDWELVQRGDSAWDLAGALHDLLAAWVRSMPIGSDLRPEQMAQAARIPLKVVKRAARGLWLAYRHASELDDAAAREQLLRSVRYAGARLIQSAYEAGVQATALHNQPVMLLQLSDNVLRDPEGACVELLGIPTGGAPR